eukprot:TRINITY_DN1713_c0_g1_i5.p2 TRINITY_DN1713_c0_g1~~TRINITY_DN1713_c0_g1_i5.p2  ORF type:complete len:215 (+),score=33.72 TRINITY_DN1713_c0_g1_i5:392-1036(+)
MANGANRVPGTSLFAVGDRRGNENMILLALHVLFLREHNRICDTLTGDDETKYQTARQLVTAYIQAITFQEYLPTLFNGNLKPYVGYDATVNTGIDFFFSGASFRYGHSEVRNDILRLNDQWKTHALGNMNLHQSYFFPPTLIETGIEAVLRGAVRAQQQEVDVFVVDAMRNNLFGFHTDVTRPQHAHDLVAINIQRGRDHGIPGYNELRTDLD